jgi:hypothetical protein
MTNGIAVNLEMSGLRLDRPMKVGAVWSSPVVAIEGDFLIYEAGRRVKQNASRGLLRGLLEARSSREKTIKFCKKWGALGLCDHGIPSAHDTSAHGKCRSRGAFRTRVIDGVPRHQYRESIDSVQRFGIGLESLLRIGAEMAQGRTGQASDWNQACGMDPDFSPWPENPSSFDLSTARTHLQILIRRLIEICRIRPRFFWNEQTSSWQIDLDSEGSAINLPALMVIELIVTIADKDGFAICSSCHRAYIPERRPDPTRRNYCPTCRSSAAARDASRDYRERNRKEKNRGKA